MKISNEAMDLELNILGSLKEQTGKLGFVIAYNKQKLNDACKTYHDIKTNLLKKYGKENKQTGYLHIDKEEDPEKFEKYIKELGDTPKIEIDVDILKLTPEELYSGTLTTSEMSNLMWMVDFPEKKKEGDKKK